jgi:bifunctional non-homologous end joining protein LigD
VSMPIAWEELTPELGPAYFTTRNTPTRLSSVPDPWADFRAAAAPIVDEGKKAKPTRKRTARPG